LTIFPERFIEKKLSPVPFSPFPSLWILILK
jgi:hypothetical protein